MKVEIIEERQRKKDDSGVNLNELMNGTRQERFVGPVTIVPFENHILCIRYSTLQRHRKRR